MPEQVMPHPDFTMVPEFPAVVTGTATLISLRHRRNQMPADLRWRIEGRFPGSEFRPSPAVAVQPIEAKFSIPGVHNLRALDHSDPTAFLAQRSFPVFEPECDEMLRALQARDGEVARLRFERLIADRRDEASRRKFVEKMEHLLLRPELAPSVLAILLETSHVKKLLSLRARGYNRDLGHIDDLTQELYVKLLPKLKSFRPEGRFDVYAAKVLERLYLDQFRADQRRPGRITRGTLTGVAEEEGEPEQAREGRESTLFDEAIVRDHFEVSIDQDKLRRMLPLLTAEEFRLVVSYCCFGMTYVAIADLMGVPVNLPANTRITKARREVQSIINKLRGLDDTPPSETEG